MSATATAISSAAFVMAVNAQNRAEDAMCESVLRAPPPSTGDIAGLRTFAGCVYRIHGTGEPLDPVSAIALKTVIILSLLFAAAGAVLGVMHNSDLDLKIFGAILFAVLGAIVPFAGGLIVLLVLAGLRFIAS